MDNVHLGIPVQRLVGSRTGVARYIAELLNAWAEQEIPFQRVTVWCFRPVRIPGKFHLCVGGTRWPRVLWEHVWVARRAHRSDVDLLFCPSNIVPFMFRGACVVTILDTLQARRPDDFPRVRTGYLRPLYRASARRADRIIAPSETTARDIVTFYGVPRDRIVVIPLGVHARFFEVDAAHCKDVRARYGPGGDPFVLFVGKLSRRRNIPILIQAFARVVIRHALPHRLILIGPNYLRIPIHRMARQWGIGRRVLHYEFIPERDLIAMYHAADLFVYLSEWEGFGLPVLEAMAAGTPVLTLDRPVFREFVGDATVRVDTADVEIVAAQMARILVDRDLHRRLQQQGPVQARQFSWTKTARRTMEVLYEVAHITT